MKSLRERFLEFENQDFIWEIQVSGVNIWRWLRQRIFSNLRDTITETEGSTASGVPYGGYLMNTPSFIGSMIFHNPLRADSSDILVHGNSRRELVTDEWWDPQWDAIADRIDASRVYMESDYNFKHRQPAKTPTVYHAEVFEYVSDLQRKLSLIDIELSDEEKSRLETIEHELEDTFDVQLSFVKHSERLLKKRKSLRPLYKRLLKQVEPEVIIVVASPGKLIFIEACKEFGAEVAELQHGNIDKNHLGYHFPKGRSSHVFPDHLLLFVDYWKEAAEFPIQDVNLHSVGYPYLEQKSKMITVPTQNHKILFVSQHTIGHLLSKFAVGLSEQLPNKYDIVYKLHPEEVSDWKEDYPWLKEKSILVEDGSGKSLYEHFAESSIQVGVYSTAIYEGIYFGLDTYLVDLPHLSGLKSLVDLGYATIVDSPLELVDWVRKGTGNPEKRDIAYIFEDNATQKTSEKISELISLG